VGFDAWLWWELIKSDPEACRAALVNWEQAPAAHVVHLRENHLIPLLAALGAAGSDLATCIY